MKIILLEDVKSVGKKGELVELKEGYAKNFILPKKLGVEATKKNLAELKGQQRSDAKKAQEILDEAKRLSEYASSQFASLEGSAIVSELPIYLLSRKK